MSAIHHPENPSNEPCGGPPPGDGPGLAGRTARMFAHSPLSPLLFIALLAIGVVGLIMTPRQEDPQISVPMIDIFVSYPGASTTQVETLAIDPLERIMSEIPGVKHVYSMASRGEGMVTVRFKVGEEMGPSLVKVHDKLQSNLDKVPPGVPMPLVKPKSIDDVPIVNLTLWSDDLDDGALRALGLKVLQSLKQIPNTGEGFVTGGRAEQIRLEVLPERLSSFGVSLDQVAQTIRTANNELNAGSAESANRHFIVYSGAYLRTATDIANLVVGSQDGTPIYVRDVARVHQGPEESTQFVSYYTGPAYAQSHAQERVAEGASAVTVAISKKVGTNGVTVANAILEKVESLHGQLIPDNVQIEVSRNYGETANAKVNELLFKLFIATGAVSLLVLWFLGFKPAVVVTAVIPVVLLVTIFCAWMMGYTIDRVSMFALIFAIGILVDDAIVVVENIYRRWLKQGTMDTATAVDAVREVGNPTILATFTVVAALLPMGFVRGLMGPYMEPIPALGSVAMVFSLLAAFAFAPWLAMRIKPTRSGLKRMERAEHKSEERLDGLFRKTLVPLIEDRRKGWRFLIALVIAFFLCVSLFGMKWVTVKMMPFDNKPEFSVVVDMPEGTALLATENAARQLTGLLRKIPEVTALQTYSGTAKPFDFNGMVRHYYMRGKPWHAEIQVQLLDKTERERSSHEIATAARELIVDKARQLGAHITVVEMPPGPPVLQTVVAEVYGPDKETRQQVAQHMTDVFEHTEGMADVDNYMQDDFEVWSFVVDTDKAVRLGASVDAINQNLSMAMGGYRVGDVKQETALEPTYIVMEIPLAQRSRTEYLLDLPIPVAGGGSVPLGELGTFKPRMQDGVVYHKDLRPVEYVVGDAVGPLGAPIYPMFKIQDALESYRTPDNVYMKGSFAGAPADNGESGFEWTGEWTVTYETFRDMGLAFMIALVAIYMMVVGMFGNFLVPAIIMAPIPLTLLGIVPGHLILGAEFTATSMIGFIALAGIIVRNSILLVDFSIAEVKKGQSVQDAVVCACKARTRPIMITALALVAGSSVILTDPIFQGMAISLLFGVMVSTVLTLIVIPLGCVSAGDRLIPKAVDADLPGFKDVSDDPELKALANEAQDADNKATQPETAS